MFQRCLDLKIKTMFLDSEIKLVILDVSSIDRGSFKQVVV